MKRNELESLIQTSMQNKADSFTEQFNDIFSKQVSEKNDRDEILMSAMVILSVTTMKESIKVIFDILEQMDIIHFDD